MFTATTLYYIHMSQDEVEERKNYMKMMDLRRQKNEKLSELEEEEREKGEYLRKKANEQLQEQEDEIKKLNEVCSLLHKYVSDLFVLRQAFSKCVKTDFNRCILNVCIIIGLFCFYYIKVYLCYYKLGHILQKSFFIK